MGFSFLHRYFILIGLLFLLLTGSGCSESTDPVASPDPDPVPYHPREVPFVTSGHGPLPGVAEVSLHELGHTLGLLNHSDCYVPEYLMVIAGGFGALDRNEPIHLDERRAVECIRYLPQGQDISRYRVD